ncbi:MAG TPA: phage/plasmid primase, P4 family [Methylomirabilota bacterium]|nr:phage/plasmid primase, P4 family [Methylomirabilota bacterium]
MKPLHNLSTDAVHFNRPGVTDEFLTLAGCHHVGADECVSLYGCRAEGIAIPFSSLDGRPIVDNGKPFARVRLYTATELQKYDQPAGSIPHIYVPTNFRELPRQATLILTEGEFKALSLAESGFVAVGLCGINGAMRDGKLNGELEEVLKFHKPATLVFLGDSDAVLNAEFSREAAKLRKELFGSRRFAFVEALRIAVCPLGGPKGVDDVRDALKADFNAWFELILTTAFQVPEKATAAEVFAALLRREKSAVKHAIEVEGHEGSRARTRLIQSAANLWSEPAAKLELSPLLRDITGLNKTELANLIKDARAAAKARPRKTRKKANGANPGQGGQVSGTPSAWFSEKFPSLAAEHGDAVLETISEEGTMSARDIGEDFLAATLGEKGDPAAPTIFLPTEEKFYGYSKPDGIFVHQREPALLARLSGLLLDCARACKANCDTQALEFRFRDCANLSGVLRKARGLLAVPDGYFSTDLTELIPCANGMLRLLDKDLLPFSPSFRRRNKLAVPYDPAAKCPIFLDTLMRPALDSDDLALLQRWFGMVLIGENLAQRIMLLTGTAGGGKGTFIRVLIGIIGQLNVASLRPHLLGERFEMGRFLGKTLLYGPDVPENFLNQRGASILKTLTGHDAATPELKNSNEVPSMTCKFNVIAACNSRLTVHLEGDEDAWRRRLIALPYTKPMPTNVIAGLDQQILEKEGAGVLNWALEGLDQLRADGWQLKLNAKQQATVDNLLLESDSCGVFGRECMEKRDKATLTIPDCFAAYVEFCNRRGWTVLPRIKFTSTIIDQVARRFGMTSRHDVLDSLKKLQRGWIGLALVGNFSQPTGEIVSELSVNGSPDISDGFLPLQPGAIANDAEAIRI